MTKLTITDVRIFQCFITGVNPTARLYEVPVFYKVQNEGDSSYKRLDFLVRMNTDYDPKRGKFYPNGNIATNQNPVASVMPLSNVDGLGAILAGEVMIHFAEQYRSSPQVKNEVYL